MNSYLIEYQLLLVFININMELLLIIHLMEQRISF